MVIDYRISNAIFIYFFSLSYPMQEPFLSDLAPVTAGSSPGVCDRGPCSGAETAGNGQAAGDSIPPEEGSRGPETRGTQKLQCLPKRSKIS